MTHAAAVRDDGHAVIHSRAGWLAVSMVVVFLMINWADKSALGLTAVPIMEELGVNARSFGLLGSAYFFLYTVSTIAFGWLATKIRVNRIMLVLVLIWSALMLPVALFASFTVLLVNRITLGVAEAPATPLGNFMAHSWFPDRRRTLASTLIMIGSPLGVMIAGPGLTAVLLAFGWRAIYLVLALLGVAWALGWAVLGREGPHAGRGGDTGAERGGLSRAGVRSACQRLVTNRSWLACTLAGFGAYWATTLSTTWLPAYFTKGLGFNTATTGRLIAITPAISIATMLLWALISAGLIRRGVSTRWSRGGLLCGTMLVGGVCLLVGTQLETAGTVALASAGLALSQPVYPLMFLLISEVSPAQLRAFSISLSAAVATTAGIAAPTVTGWFVASAPGPDGYTASFLCCAALMVLGGAAALVINPQRDAPDQPGT
jgi:MFS family permease